MPRSRRRSTAFSGCEDEQLRTPERGARRCGCHRLSCPPRRSQCLECRAHRRAYTLYGGVGEGRRRPGGCALGRGRLLLRGGGCRIHERRSRIFLRREHGRCAEPGGDVPGGGGVSEAGGGASQGGGDRRCGRARGGGRRGGGRSHNYICVLGGQARHLAGDDSPVCFAQDRPLPYPGAVPDRRALRRAEGAGDRSRPRRGLRRGSRRCGGGEGRRAPRGWSGGPERDKGPSARAPGRGARRGYGDHGPAHRGAPNGGGGPGGPRRLSGETRARVEGALVSSLREPPFGKLLVANRGEVAVRVIRACRELGVTSVAVYSEADENAMHVRLADEAYPVGPASAADSYLNIEKIVAAAKESGSEAVHPGYGFLSENANFARAVEEAGIVWVGPPAGVMESVGDKVRAKELARGADVPTVPGYAGEEDESEERVLQEAESIGLPVLVKASAGGGGRGMRPVWEPEDLAEAVRGARREAEAAFGDGSVFLEKLVKDPRHVEVQVVGDSHGDVLHLFERECSIQRRHQKVIEEAPSPALDPDLRESICNASVRFAREAGYENAGTVEFLLDGDEFYFLEMNARLQVEHPVTEFVTGLDLVHLQLAVAAGEPLRRTQDEITPRGSAIEARIYAENEQGMPSGGLLESFSPPEGAGVRNDAGFEAGDEIPLNYDAMLTKLIVYAPDRPATVRRLRRSLTDYESLGPSSNLPLLRRIAVHPP